MKKNPLIEQTAKDYNLDYEIVKEIYDRDKDHFYEKLEAVLQGETK